MTFDSEELRQLVPMLIDELKADGIFILAIRGEDCFVAAAGSDDFVNALPQLLEAGARAQYTNTWGGTDAT